MTSGRCTIRNFRGREAQARKHLGRRWKRLKRAAQVGADRTINVANGRSLPVAPPIRAIFDVHFEPFVNERAIRPDLDLHSWRPTSTNATCLIHCPRLPFDRTRSDLIVQPIIIRKSIRYSKRRHTNRFDQLYHLDYRA